MDLRPSNKVALGAVTGAAVVILAWASQQFGKISLPAEIQGAFQVVLTFIVQYFVPDSAPPSEPME